MEIKRLSDALGVEISGIDVARLDDRTVTEVRDAFHEHQVIVFRDQDISVDDHIAFSRRFGDLEIHISTDHLLKDHPEILLVTNKKEKGKYIGVENAGDEWHSDLSYMDKPSLGSLLYALEVSQDGGDTEWSNMYTAYETLPDTMKQRLKGLQARHSFNRFRNPRIGIPEQHKANAEERYAKISPPDVIHPVVRTHPVTKRKALYVSPRFTIGIEGLPENEGQALLDELFEHAVRRDFIYHHEWRLGDLLFWDNRCTLHLACRGIPEGQIRHMHRTTISGDVPV
jgi:taurine dioxygenase